MSFSIEELRNLYIDLLKCFEEHLPGFELVRLIDEFFKSRNMEKIVIPKEELRVSRTFGLSVLLTIKKEAIKLGGNPLGSYKKRTADFIKQKIQLAISYIDSHINTLKKKFPTIKFETKQQEYLRYLKSREVKPTVFICPYCGVDVEIIQKDNMERKKFFCPYCGKKTNLE